MSDGNPSMKKVEAGGSSSESSAKIEGVGLFIAMAALAMSTLSVGLWVATMVFAPQIVESKIKAGVAKAEADAANAAAVSEVWRNRVNKLEAEANANRRR